MSTQNDTTQSSPRRNKRVLLLSVFGGAFLLIGAAYTVYWSSVLRYRQSTDDAYVNGNVVQITPQISGTVVSIGADDTQFVKAGQTLVRLDQADAKVAFGSVGSATGQDGTGSAQYVCDLGTTARGG